MDDFDKLQKKKFELEEKKKIIKIRTFINRSRIKKLY